jgi:hypothetical protein
MRALTMLAVVALALSGTVQADKPDKHDRPENADKGKHKDRDAGSDVTLVFTSDQRDRARGFFVETYGRGNCPPGLAKKRNGCLPPGQAKRRYTVGRPLPSGIAVQPLPGELSVRIGPAPSGYRYAIVDGDLVKLVVGTLLVVDAIEGLVD